MSGQRDVIVFIDRERLAEAAAGLAVSGALAVTEVGEVVGEPALLVRLPDSSEVLAALCSAAAALGGRVEDISGVECRALGAEAVPDIATEEEGPWSCS